MTHKIACLKLDDITVDLSVVEQEFDVDYFLDIVQMSALDHADQYDAWVVMALDMNQLMHRVEEFGLEPIVKGSVLIIDNPMLEDRLQAIEFGVGDIINGHSDAAEISARCLKVIFDIIANRQLKQQLDQANQMVFMAMTNTSDLGVNLQFLLESFSCSDLNQLGVLFFRAINSYGISCSLQMRGCREIKNMEANGMAKELESALLNELQHVGRYYEFGQRCVMNYESVSVLVKDMPPLDSPKYGAIKDNMFSLLQGVHAQVQALDNQFMVQREQQMMLDLTLQMKHYMETVEKRYKTVMDASAAVVGRLSQRVYHLQPCMGLTLEQEKTLEMLIEEALYENHKVFSAKMRVDGKLPTLLAKAERLTQAMQTSQAA